MKDSTKTIILIVLVLVLAMFISTVVVDKFLTGDLGKSFDFCDREGYDNVNLLNGVYSKYYGKIECVAYFGNDKETKVFNVREDWRGKLVKV